jgi:competence protein ComEC
MNFILGFCISCFWSVYWVELPDLNLLNKIIVAFVLLLCLMKLCVIKFRRERRFQTLLQKFTVPMLFGMTIGAYWATSVGENYRHWQQLVKIFTDDTFIKGEITAATQGQRVSHYTLRLFEVNLQPVNNPVHLRISDYYPKKHFIQGQWVSAQVKLKVATGLANPAGFDYETWLASQNITHSGYVKHNSMTLLTPNTQVRERLLLRLRQVGGGELKWAKALLFGDRSGFSEQDWQLLQDSGTAHLFSISGLHLGIVGSWSFALFTGIAWLQFYMTKIQLPHLHYVRMLFMLLTTLAYSYVANWQIPVVRAWLLLLIFSVCIVLPVKFTRSQIALLMLFACLLVFPQSVYGVSLYLSVGAVFAIWLLSWRWQLDFRQWREKLQSTVILQFSLSLLLLPLIASTFGQVPLYSAIINLFLVPFVSLFVVPLYLLSLVLLSCYPPWASPILAIADYLIYLVMQGLQRLETHLPLFTLPVDLPPSFWWWSFCALLLWVCPSFRYRKHLLLMSVLASVLTWWPRELSGWQLHVLDVGQGTSILLTRHGHGALFDTGGSFGKSSMAESVVVPMVNYLNIESLDWVAISHFDNDHAGGLDYLKAWGKVKQWYSPENQCVKGNQWQWQGLTIKALWPLEKVKDAGNNDSCVLLISDGHHAVLLPGDIESAAEYQLVSQGMLSNVDVLIAPHHGSKTSSTAEFIQSLSPQDVVFTQRWGNRWKFPHDQVVERYEAMGSQTHSSGEDGYIRVWFKPDGTYDLEGIRHISHNQWYRYLSQGKEDIRYTD